MSVGSGGQAMAPLDFHNDTNVVNKGLIMLHFWPFLIFFGLFSIAPPPWKRLNIAIFGLFGYLSIFFPLATPGNFSADAFAYSVRNATDESFLVVSIN